MVYYGFRSDLSDLETDNAPLRDEPKADNAALRGEVGDERVMLAASDFNGPTGSTSGTSFTATHGTHALAPTKAQAACTMQ